MKNVDIIRKRMESLEDDVKKLESGKVKAAATRVRLALLDIMKACKEGRKEATKLRDKI